MLVAAIVVAVMVSWFFRTKEGMTTDMVSSALFSVVVAVVLSLTMKDLLRPP